jgi:hypothetical protein
MAEMSEKPMRRFQFSLRMLLIVMVVCAIASAGNPLVLMVLLYCGFFTYLFYSAGQLPPCVASHFDIRGQADQRMDRAAYLWLIGFLVLLVPPLLPGISLVAGKGDAHFVRHALWFACLLLGLLFAMHVRVVEANRETPAELFHVGPILFLFFACATVWVITFVALRPVPAGVPAVKKAPLALLPIGGKGRRSESPLRSIQSDTRER